MNALILDELKIALDTYIESQRALLEVLGAEPALIEAQIEALKTFIRVLSERATNMAAQAALLLSHRFEERLAELEREVAELRSREVGG